MPTQKDRIPHFIPPENFAPLIKEFVEPRADDYFIWWLFDHRCIVCRRPATEINEIIPRGRSKKSILDWRNRVTLCQEHHTGQNGFHHHGVTDDKIRDMQELRKNYLISVGREMYVT